MAGRGPNNFEFRRQSQRVSQDNRTGDVILRLHQTDIVRVRPNGDVLLCTGGWATHKTLASMNDALELFGMWVEAKGNPPNGNWTVTDSDGTVHKYMSATAEPFTVPAKPGSADDKLRAQWLAEAYEIVYNPALAAAAAGPRRAAAPAGPRLAVAQPAAAPQPAPAAAAANGWGQAAAVAPAARPPGVGGSWANIAKSVTSQHQASTGPAAARVTGPGAAAAGRVTGPGGATSSAAALAAGPGPSHRTTGPPGFGNSSSTAGTSGVGYPGVPMSQMAPAAAAAASQTTQSRPAATVMAAPPLPHTVPHTAGGGAHTQLVQQMAQMGLDHDLEDDAQLCVVCMEEMRSIVLVPCGHLALCKDCCEHIIVQQRGQCPMCCQDVEYHVEVDQ